MSQTKSVEHTPGPWTVGDFDDCGSLSAQGSCGGGYEVDGPDRGPHGYKNQADAKLIAAAPDLLEALRALVEEHDAPRYGTHEKRANDWAAARVAIAKAEGT